MSGTRWAAGWRPALRMAWREARRAKARSALVLVMIALPVLGVTAADVVLETQEVSGAESLERRLGAADARLVVSEGGRTVWQGPDPDRLLMTQGRFRGGLPGLAEAERALGREVRGLRWRTGATTGVLTEKGVADADTTVVDLADPLAEGLFVLDAGRVPEAEDEVVVNTALAERGFDVGAELELRNGTTYDVVGVGDATDHHGYPRLFGLDEDLVPLRGGETWLVDAGPVTWPEVGALNRAGFSVLSRAVVLDPPPESALPMEVRGLESSVDRATVAVVVLVAVMALIEVVLLAGPAFAVGARRRSRTLALLAASGGTPRQARRVVLASGVVLGGLGAAVGVALGLVAAWALLPVAQRFSGSWFGPYDVPWPHLLAIAGFGLASAVLAALVPAWIASRQDVVAVLAGRRGDRAPSLRSPLLGLLLLGVGAAGAAYGASARSNGEFFIAFSALPSVLGMVLLIPVVVVSLARASGRLPLSMRYAVRDAARHRTRTVPAVAAVAATVAGVVAFGIANASDAEQNRASYQPQLPDGMAAVEAGWARADAWARLADAVDSALPGQPATMVHGVPQDLPGRGWLDVRLDAPDRVNLLDSYGGPLASTVLVGEEAVDLVAASLAEPDADRARQALAAGSAVVLTTRDRLPEADVVRVVARGHGPLGNRPEPVRAEVAAEYLRVVGATAPVQALLPEATAAGLGLPVTTVGLLVDGPVSEVEERDLEEAVAAVSDRAFVYVERGFQNDDETVVVLLVLGTLGGLLMLGGTLTATFLSLSDARPDLATLSAVGAAPRTRRAVAASYALVVGLVGAALGAVVGAIPGVAVTYPLTGGSWVTVDAAGADLPDHFLAVPWLLVGTVVLALPVLTALVVALTARSRLPMVARVE